MVIISFERAGSFVMSNTRGLLFTFDRYLAATVTFSLAVSPGAMFLSLKETLSALLNTCKVRTCKVRFPSLRTSTVMDFFRFRPISPMSSVSAESTNRGASSRSRADSEEKSGNRTDDTVISFSSDTLSPTSRAR